MKSQKIFFINHPNRVIVCESCTSDYSVCIDRETRDLREYARIVPTTAEIGGIWLTRFQFAGDIEWTRHAHMLSDNQRQAVIELAATYADKHKEATARAKELQAYQRVKYADKIAKYGEADA